MFASLIAAMILPFSSMDLSFAQADNSAKIEEFKQKALRDNVIPTSELLERVGDKWLADYRDSEHFENEQSAVSRYVERNSDQSGLNGDNAKHITAIQNFETITNSVGDGHEIVLLVAELEKAQGKYNPSEPVRKYHEWLATQYTVSDDPSESLLEIVGDKRFLNLAKKHAQNFNDLADNGAVPSDLMNTDPSYWNILITLNHCELDSECDVDAIKHQPGATQEQIDEAMRKVEDTTNVGFDIFDYILPKAFAFDKVYVNYTLAAVINLEACYYNNCYESWFDSTNTNAQSIDHDQYDSPSEHVYRYYDMSFYGTLCDTYYGSENVINEVDTTPYLAQSLETSLSENDLQINGCATTSNTSEATHDWIVGILVESDGSFYWD